MTDLFSQLRLAHRICASAYNRIFPLLQRVPEYLGAEFISWGTHSYNHHTRSKTPVWSALGEEHIPLYDSDHTFYHAGKGRDEYVLVLRFVMDTIGAVDITDRLDDFMERDNDIIGDPNNSQSLVIAYVYRAVKRNGLDLLSAVPELTYVPYPRSPVTIENNVQVSNYVYNMADWVSDNDLFLNKLKIDIQEGL